MKNSKGVIYTAGGKQEYIDEAIYSARSLKKYNPQLGTTLFTTNKDIKSKYFDNIITQEANKHPQKYKVENMLKSPYDFTLYIDSDTEFTDNIEELFDFLLVYDMGVTNRVKCKWSSNPVFIDYIDKTCYNGGFLLFKKNEKTEKLLKAWSDKMHENKDEEIKAGTPTGDQIPLNNLFFEEDLAAQLNMKCVILPNKIYNARPWLWKQAKEDGEFQNIKILHAKGLNKLKFKKIIAKVKHRFKKINNDY